MAPELKTAVRQFLVCLAGSGLIAFVSYLLWANGAGVWMLWIWLAVNVLLFFGLVVRTGLDVLKKARKEAHERIAKEQIAAGVRLADELDDFIPPEDLINAMNNRECVLVAGEGIGALSGIPEWSVFVQGLAEWLGRLEIVPETQLAPMRARIHSGGAKEVGEALLTLVSERAEVLEEYTASTYLKTAALSDVHRLLPEVPFAAMVTPALDELLERAYKSHQVQPLPAALAAEAAVAVRDHQFFMLKTRGVWSSGHPICVSPFAAADLNMKDRIFHDLMKTLVEERTLLFIGVSGQEIEQFFALLPEGTKTDRQHYAVISSTDKGWKNRIAAVSRVYRMHGLEYRSRDARQLCAFLGRLLPAQQSVSDVAVQ
jgi:hypothetical protein